MSVDNVDLIQQAVEAFNLGVLSMFLALCHPEIRFMSRLVPIDGDEPRRGHGGVRSWWDALHAAFQELKAETENVRDLGGVTVARISLTGRRARNDTAMQQTQWHVVHWVNATAISWRIFLSEDDALNAAGLRE